MKNDNDNSLAHGVGAGLLALLGMFGRCADDVARIGARSVDDFGRACINSTDDIGSMMSRNSDDLLRPIDDCNAANCVDDLRFEISNLRAILNESDEGVSLARHVAQEVAEATLEIIDLNDSKNDK